MSQKQRILQILGDFAIHCLTNEMFCKDDRSRISELRRLGYTFNENLGNCTDQRHRHGAGLKLRQIIGNPLNSDIRPPYKELPKDFKQTVKYFKVDNWIGQWKPEKVKTNRLW